MSNLFEKPVPVGKSENYTFTFPTTWTGVTVITAADVTAPPGVTVSQISYNQNVVGFRAEGVTQGRHPIHCSVTLSDGRGDCVTGFLTVSDC